MPKIVVFCDILLAQLDVIAIVSLRDILKDFLIGARNRKSAMAIYLQQPLRKRVTLSFIKPFLKNHIVAFNVHLWIYRLELITLIPQYAMLFVVSMVYGTQNKWLLVSLIAIKGLLCLALRLQVDSLMRSKYRKGK